MTKSLNTLPEDIMELFNPDVNHEPDEENIQWAMEEFGNLLRTRLKERDNSKKGTLRFSSMGKPDRQVWYAAQEDVEAEPMTAKTYFKFLYGDAIELLVLFLAREAGHSVEDTQREIEVGGVKGHIDAIIDGVVVDVKSASPFSYKKFQENSILENDPFGYVQQLAGYASVLTPGESAAWVAFDKVHGDVCVTPLSQSIIRDFDPGQRIEHLKAVIQQPEPPERCYSDVPDGKSGNRKLDTACSYCAFKNRCWPGLRTFLYSNKPVFLTHVERQPKVPELIEGTIAKPEVTD